jgi:RNA polymerase sigma-70 factor (ECF subfamily)
MGAQRKAMESMSCTEDSLLVREAQAGNHAAFDQLVQCHDRAVLGLVFRITRSQNDIEDIYQEALLKVFRNIGRFRFESTFSTWIYRIVTNVCLDHLRKNRNNKTKSTVTIGVEGEEYNLLDQISDDRPAHDPEHELFRLELRANILSALERLTPRERMAFELRHFQELKISAVSEILNTSVSSTKTTLFRARQKLRSQLAEKSKRTNLRCGHTVLSEV